MTRHVRGVLAWIGTHERETLIALLLVALCGWGFAELADEVTEGETAALDERLLLAMRVDGDPTDPIGPLWFEELARDVTALGGMGFLTILTLAAVGFLVLQRNGRLALYLAIAVSSGAALSTLFKSVFDRPRPDLVPHGQHVYTASFPSGHSMMAAVTLFTVAALLASAQPNLRLRAYLLGLATLLSIAVGLSRVYLGVHWPTDVLAGWTAGTAWALLCWSVVQILRRRRRRRDE